jgi:hypothetical protein
MGKTTTASLEKNVPATLNRFKDSAAAVKAAHKAARQAILDDKTTSDYGKEQLLASLNQDTRSKLDGIKSEQETYVKGLRTQIEQELRGSQPKDANSILLRRDASDRARKITDKQEALDVLNDAIRNGDDEMAHAIGVRARNTGMFAVAEAYKAAYSTTSDSAEAPSYVEEVTSGPAYNLAYQITYSAPVE